MVTNGNENVKNIMQKSPKKIKNPNRKRRYKTNKFLNSGFY